MSSEHIFIMQFYSRTHTWEKTRPCLSRRSHAVGHLGKSHGLAVVKSTAASISVHFYPMKGPLNRLSGPSWPHHGRGLGGLGWRMSRDLFVLRWEAQQRGFHHFADISLALVWLAVLSHDTTLIGCSLTWHNSTQERQSSCSCTSATQWGCNKRTPFLSMRSLHYNPVDSSRLFQF